MPLATVEDWHSISDSYFYSRIQTTYAAFYTYTDTSVHYLKNNKSSVFYYIFACFIPIFQVINVTLPQI